MTAANSHAQVLAADSHEPKAHASTHESGGSDELDVTGLTGAGGGGGGTPTFVGAKAYHSTTQSLSASTLTALLMNSEEYDTDAFHSTSSNTPRMTVPAGKDGYYLIVGSMMCAASPSVVIVQIRKNGTTALRSDTIARPSAGTSSLQVSVMAALSAGDYIELMGYTGNAISVGDASVAEQQNSLALTLLGT